MSYYFVYVKINPTENICNVPKARSANDTEKYVLFAKQINWVNDTERFHFQVMHLQFSRNYPTK